MSGASCTSILSCTEQHVTDLETKIRDKLVQISKEGSPKQVVDFYNDNPHEYNQMSEQAQWYTIGCRAIAEAVAELQPNKEARILDCAAGSGYAGQQLNDLGYINIDALDPSEGMLRIARLLDVYKNIIVDSVYPDKRNSIADATYDTILISGGVLQGHITLECLPELTRMLKKGGTLTFNVGDKFLKTDPTFQEEAVNKRFQEYVDDGQWSKWEVMRAPYRIVDEELEECNIYNINLF